MPDNPITAEAFSENLVMDWSDLDRILEAATAKLDPREALRSVLRATVTLTQATAGAIYRLRLDRGSFHMEVFEAGGTLAPNSFPADLRSGLATSAENASSLSRSLVARQPMLISEPDGLTSALITPIGRTGSSVCVLYVRPSRPPTDHDLRVCTTAANLMSLVFDKDHSLRLLQTLQVPIDYHHSLDHFLDDLLLLVAEASGMPFIAIREFDSDGNALRCIATYGFGDIDKTLLDLDPIDQYPSFRSSLIERRAIIEPTLDAPHLGNLRARNQTSGIRSFVVLPIPTGTSVFGTLSLGAACAYEYSPLEVAGFATIAAVVGTAITNYRNAHRVQELFAQDAKISSSIIGLEVAQVARHEARSIIDNCQLQLAFLAIRSRHPERYADFERDIQPISEGLQLLNKVLDRIRDISRTPTREMSFVSLRELWQEAITLVSRKLTDERIDIRFQGSNVTAKVYPDLLRHAFLHLLLNSIEAFQMRRTKAHRQISVNVVSSNRDRKILMRYVDNAGGIRFTDLHIPPELKHLSSSEIIFQSGVSSKPTGSGWGLYLVRRILDDHYGSIDLVDYRGGIVLDLTLPKDVQSEQI